MANSTDLDETTHSKQSHLDLHCLQFMLNFSRHADFSFLVCTPLGQTIMRKLFYKIINEDLKLYHDIPAYTCITVYILLIQN